MNSIWLIFLLKIFLINQIRTTNLRCYEDTNGSFRLVENCRACVIYIDAKIHSAVSARKISINDEPSSLQEFFLYEENKRRRRRRNLKTIVHQKCAREFAGPLYGFDQTHCYCNSNLCNSNIQRCIYEIASKRYFSCYHGSNSSQNSLEIYKKCRSCRIRKEFSLIYHYECLSFGEQEQKSETHCTCQHPMCNQDFSICQRFQQIPSQPRVNSIHEHLLNSTKNPPTTITSSTSTINSTIFTMTNQTEIEFSTENSTLIELTSVSLNETQTILIEMKNQAHSFRFNFSFYFIFIFLLFM